MNLATASGWTVANRSVPFNRGKSMSIFSNPPPRSPDLAEAYVEAVVELVEDRDPLEILRSTPTLMMELLTGLPDELLDAPEEVGKWSVREVARHLADSELVWAVRLRMVLAQERPTLEGYDQEAWASRLRYREADLDATLREFGGVRSGNLALLEGLSTDELRRVGMHTERGEETVEQMVSLYAGHDLVHLRQVRRILEAVGGPSEPGSGMGAD